MNPVSYTSFIQAAKKYANQGESQRLQLMRLLLDTQPRKAVWQDNPNHTLSWEALLREEGLCTPALFYNFKRATSVVNVDVFGVYASAAIVKLKKDYRGRIIRQTQKWIESHKVRPTYQRITKYVQEIKKELGIRRPATPLQTLRAENSRLKRELVKSSEINLGSTRYIVTLQATLKKHNLQIPREPSS